MKYLEVQPFWITKKLLKLEANRWVYTSGYSVKSPYQKLCITEYSSRKKSNFCVIVILRHKSTNKFKFNNNFFDKNIVLSLPYLWRKIYAFECTWNIPFLPPPISTTLHISTPLTIHKCNSPQIFVAFRESCTSASQYE